MRFFADFENQRIKRSFVKLFMAVISSGSRSLVRLVAAHAGLKQEYIGRGSMRVRDFCLYGETTGEFDSYGLPVRLDWASDYRGRAMVVYGHIAGKE